MSEIPFSRPVAVSDVPPSGSHLKIVAEPSEREALAKLLKVPEVKRLEARFDVKHWGRDGLAVTGEVDADVVQVCVVTLDPFETTVREEIDVRYTAHETVPKNETPGAEYEADLDAPDVLDNGRADLGRLAAEFLALGLDPYPRKPGADAGPGGEATPPTATHKPFAGLDRLVAKANDKKN